MRYTTILSLLSLILVGAPSIARADFNIATVDVNRVLNESKEAQANKEALDKRSADARKKIEAKGKELKALEEKLKAANVKEDSKEVEAFRTQARDFNRMIKDTEEDLKKDFLKFNKALTDKALKIVQDYAKKNEIELVLDKSSEGKSAILFGAAEFDITESVVQAMNKG